MKKSSLMLVILSLVVGVVLIEIVLQKIMT